MMFDRAYHETVLAPYAAAPLWAEEAAMAIDLVAAAFDVREASLLDVGCGDGQLLVVAGKRFPTARLNGLEVNAYSVALGAARNSQVNFCLYDGARAHMRAESFEAATCVNTLGHVADPALTLGEIHRLLTPGGLLGLVIPNQLFYDRVPVFNGSAGDATIQHCWGPGSLAAAVGAAGFDVLEVRSFGAAAGPDPVEHARVALKARKP